jgi:hypothetical protein
MGRGVGAREFGSGGGEEGRALRSKGASQHVLGRMCRVLRAGVEGGYRLVEGILCQSEGDLEVGGSWFPV